MTATPPVPPEFLAEASEVLDALGQSLLALEKQRGERAEPQLINGIFRGAHSLKGLAAMFGLERVAQLAHLAEDLLDRLRLGRVSLTDAVLDTLVDAVDVLQLLVTEEAAGAVSPRARSRADELSARLMQLESQPERLEADPLDALVLDPAVRAVLTHYEEHRLRENVRQGVGLWRVRLALDLSDFDRRLAGVHERLQPDAELVSTLPSSLPESETEISFELVVATRLDAAELGRRVAEPSAQLTPLEVLRPPGDGPSEEEAPEVTRALTQTVRVDIHRLDSLMNTVGELLLIKNHLQQLAEGSRGGGSAVATRQWGQALMRESRLLERRLDVLQKDLLATRMFPLRQVFDTLGRRVRSIAREAGKEIDFEMTGSDVELDKLIVEGLSEPLMHIIHNALDHGVERPDERLAVGKRARATLSLRARQDGSHVVIEVRDDGRGIDEARVLEVALKKGLVRPEQVQGLDRRELLELIFLPGFSTARTLSELSGRGVGLDVVRNNIGRLSGVIDVWSEPESGSAFTLTLPVTLAIFRGLVVGVSERTYALPLNRVTELLSVRPEDLSRAGGLEVTAHRGESLRVLRLADLFGMRACARERAYVVVVGVAPQRLGLLVDALHGQHDIVTKPLGKRLPMVPGISGATDLGNRQMALVLDVAALIEEGLRAKAS